MAELTEEKIKLVLKKDWDYPPHPEREQGHFVGRKKEVDRLVDNLLRKSSGSILVSGDRGVGKTALVYKALQEVRKVNNKTIFVILNALQLEIESDEIGKKKISHGLKEKIIKNLIRRFYAAVKAEDKVKGAIKSELADLYKKAIASEVKITEKTGIIDVESEEELITIIKELKIPISAIKAIILSVCVGAAVFLQFNPLFSGEVLNKILPLLALFPLPLVFLYSWKHQKTRSTQKEKSKSAEEYYKFDANIGNLEFDFEQVLNKLNKKEYKIIFVVDELDKLGENSVIQAIKSFKNLFNLSSSIFILITGKEIFDLIEKSKIGRTTDYTIFTNRLFLSRPSFTDIEDFIDEIIEKPNMEELLENCKYRDFRNYLCFKAKDDFFDLYNVIPDFITDFNDEHYPQIILPELGADEILESRLQKAMGQIFNLYKWDEPSRWYDNESLLFKFYTFLDNLAQKTANKQFDDSFKDDTQFEKKVKRDFCKYLARLEALSKVSEQSTNIDGKSEVTTTYQWMARCNKVPSKVSTLMEFEDIFVQKFDFFSDKILEIINEYRKSKFQTSFSIRDLQKKTEEMLQLLKKMATLDLTSIYDQFNKIKQSLKQKPPEHYKRKELEQHTKSLDEQINTLKNNSKIFVDNILKELFPSEQISQLQNNTNLFSITQDLRTSIISKGVQHSVIFRQDLSKQILFTLNIPKDLIDNNKKLIIQNTKTLKLVNIQTDVGLDYKKIKAGFWNINVTDNFNDISKVIKKVKRWF